MRRWVAVSWHASFSCIAAALFFLFVLPRWWELTGVTGHTLGTVLRIVAGALIGLAALPVVFTLLRTRRPELRTPALALKLRTTSIVLHVLAGVLIVGAAISEIWLSLDSAGQWLFGSYGAAAAIALLGIFAFYLADIAELPPPPPKPVKVKSQRGRRGRGKDAGEATTDEVEETESAETTEPADVSDTADTVEADVPAVSLEKTDTGSDDTAPAPADDTSAETDTSETTASDETTGNGRSAKGATTRRRRRRSRGGVAVDD